MFVILQLNPYVDNNLNKTGHLYAYMGKIIEQSNFANMYT